MNFFEVTAKCGHVGKGHYYEGLFYVRAESGSEAAAKVRFMPRVKHDHKDAILKVIKIDYAEFKAGQAANRDNPYFQCHSKQEQQAHITVIESGIHIETDFGKHKRHDNADRKSKLEILRRDFRKMDKYGYYDIGA